MAYEIIIDGFTQYSIIDGMMSWLTINVGPEKPERSLKYMVGNTVVFTSHALKYEHADKAVYRALNDQCNHELMREEHGALDYGWSIIKEYWGDGWSRFECAENTIDLNPLFTAFTIVDYAYAVQFKLIFAEHIHSVKQVL